MRRATWTVVVVVVVAVASASAAMTIVREQPAPGPSVSGDWTADARQTWTGDDGRPRVQFNLQSEAGDSRWGFGVPAEDLQGVPPSAFGGVARDVSFTWAREAGTFHFSGSFADGKGDGRYRFTANPAYVTAMAGLGYQSLEPSDIVRLAVLDVTTAYVRELGQAGYPNLALADLTRMRIHRVEASAIRELAALGYRNLRRFAEALAWP